MDSKTKIIIAVAIIAVLAIACVSVVIISNQDQGKTINSLDDLVGANLGAQTGTTGDIYITEHYEGDGKTSIFRYTTYPDLVMDLKNKKIDAIVMDRAPAQAYVDANKGIKILDAKLDTDIESYAFVFKKGNVEMKTAFDLALADLELSGKLAEIEEYWSGHLDGQADPFIKETGTGKTIKVGTSPDFEPYDGLYGPTFTGIDMDIIRAICNKLDYKVEFGSYDFESIILAVDTGYFDVGASGFSITAERAEKVLFSNSYASSEQVAVVRA